MIQFNDRKNATHELSLTVHDSGPGWNVWLAEVEGDTRYFEAADDLEVWDLIDLAVHCYDEEPEAPREFLDMYAFDQWESNLISRNEAAKRAEMFKEYTRAGQSLPETVEGADLKRLSEMNAPKIEYPALYRKLLSPEEFTD